MIKSTLLIAILLATVQCNPVKQAIKEAERYKMDLLDLNTYQLEEISDDASYGYTSSNPIKVGGAVNEHGVLHQRRYLNALLGPRGEQVRYKNVGTCCYYKQENGEVGNLERFEITYEYSKAKNILFLNIFEEGELLAPRGFTFKKKQTDM